jgi:hypothetical protein
MAGPRVSLYSAPECHLCDLAAEILSTLSRDLTFRWERVNIETDPELLRRFRYEIPVIEIEGGAVLRWPTTRERVRRAIEAASGRP